ncbi:hypothetical protein AAEU41_06785 [Pantoea agglomerans]
MLKSIMNFLKQFFNSFIRDYFNDIYWYGTFIFSAFLSGMVTANIDDIKISRNIILGIFIIVFVIAFRFKDKG